MVTYKTWQTLGGRLATALLLVIAGAAAAAEPGAETPTTVLVPISPDASGAADFSGDLREEVGALRTEVRDLREAIEALLTEDVLQLQRENAQLRAEIRRLQAELASDGRAVAGPVLPRPANGPERLPQSDAPVEVEEGVAPAPFQIVAEWGRTPEEAAAVGADTASLKGLVGWVPGGATDAALAALGRELHQRYGAFDNVNIELFATEEAARAYADDNKLDKAKRLLTVSRYAKTGQDVVLLTTQGVTREVTP
jgi:hypothetical protein